MKEEILKTLKDLLSFKTYKENLEEFEHLYDYIKENYKSLNIKEYEYDGKKALVLSNTEEKDLDLIIGTHIDVVYAENYDFKEDEENIYGRGTIDMKGGVAVALNVMKNINTDKKIALFITPDEETTGDGSINLLEHYTSKFAIIPDGGSDFELISEEKGMLQLELSIETKTAHAAQLFNGQNAILELIKVYEEIIKKYPLPKDASQYITSVNLSTLNGGESKNQVPGFASMVLDIRNVAKDNQEDIINFIKGINDKVKVTLIFSNPCFTTDLNNSYVKKYLKTCEEILKKDIKVLGCETTSDAVFFGMKNIPTVIMNPKGYYAHSPEEYLNKDSLTTLYEIYIKFIKEEL